MHCLDHKDERALPGNLQNKRHSFLTTQTYRVFQKELYNGIPNVPCSECYENVQLKGVQTIDLSGR
jgi:hypothetical protein